MITLNGNFLSQDQLIFANYLGIPLSTNGYSVEFKKSDCLSIYIYEKKIEINYSITCEIYRALALLKSNIEQGKKYEQPRSFDSLAAFLDCSRNAVMKPDAVKEFILNIAALGFNQLYLYTEDTYEIPEYPYFGHLRGRYTKAEIREIDAFAKKYGIELIPAIQTLSHLGTIFHWDCFSNVGAYGTLYCGKEETYDLIDKMFASIRDMYSTDKINVGMDEAHNLGANDMEKFLKHLQRVCEIAKKYGFKPMMWSDMFFKIARGKVNFDQIMAMDFARDVLDSIPDDIGLVYWNYSECTPEFYDEMIKSHLDMGKRILFAGGARKWIGFCPQIDGSMNAGRNALPKCIKYGVKDVIITGWGDCGAEASAYTMLPSLVLWAEECYSNDMTDETVDKRLNSLFGYSLDDFRVLEKLNIIPNKPSNCANTAKLLLINDPIIGQYDKHIPDNISDFCKEITKQLCPLKEKDNKLNYVFETIYYLSDLLEMKSDLGNILRKKYKSGDKEGLMTILETIPEMITRLDKFHQVFRKNWLKENKIFGFEIQDIRIGALRARLCYVGEILENYLSGKIDEIPELCVDMMYIDCREEGYSDPLNKNIPQWSTIVSPNVL